MHKENLYSIIQIVDKKDVVVIFNSFNPKSMFTERQSRSSAGIEDHQPLSMARLCAEHLNGNKDLLYFCTECLASTFMFQDDFYTVNGTCTLLHKC